MAALGALLLSRQFAQILKYVATFRYVLSRAKASPLRLLFFVRPGFANKPQRQFSCQLQWFMPPNMEKESECATLTDGADKKQFANDIWEYVLEP